MLSLKQMVLLICDGGLSSVLHLNLTIASEVVGQIGPLSGSTLPSVMGG